MGSDTVLESVPDYESSISTRAISDLNAHSVLPPPRSSIINDACCVMSESCHRIQDEYVYFIHSA